MHDIKIVQSCPTSKEEWDKNAYNKKCTDKAKRKNCTNAVSPLQYHCLINAYLNETLEVCAPKRFIFGNDEKCPFQLSNFDLFITIDTLTCIIFFSGFCAEFNVAGRVIQSHHSAECNNVFPKCDQIYSSNNAYKCMSKIKYFHI